MLQTYDDLMIKQPKCGIKVLIHREYNIIPISTVYYVVL